MNVVPRSLPMIVAAFLLAASPTYACSPLGLTPEEVIDQAALIVRGTVTEVVMRDEPSDLSDFRWFTMELGAYYKDTTQTFAPVIRVVNPWPYNSCAIVPPPEGSTYLLVSSVYWTGDPDGWIADWEANYNIMPMLIEDLLDDPIVVATETASWSALKAHYER